MKQKLELSAEVSERWAADVRHRRELSKSSLLKGGGREGDAKGVDGPLPATFTPKYRQDSEAYKRRPGVKEDVVALLKGKDRILGFKVR